MSAYRPQRLVSRWLACPQPALPPHPEALDFIVVVVCEGATDVTTANVFGDVAAVVDEVRDRPSDRQIGERWASVLMLLCVRAATCRA
jgi:hypothetical protein